MWVEVYEGSVCQGKGYGASDKHETTCGKCSLSGAGGVLLGLRWVFGAVREATGGRVLVVAFKIYVLKT